MPPHPHAVEAARRTGHTRYLELCDPDHPDYAPGYLPLVESIALGVAHVPPAPTPELPSVWTQAVNLAGSVITHVAAGMPRASDSIYEARLKVCATCPNLLRPDWRCAGMTGCGCYLKTKARWAEQSCPLGKWEALADDGPCDRPGQTIHGVPGTLGSRASDARNDQ
ncbi:MAG: hypothetical protein NVSMB9_31280 [Isosphaeraceae bacterium]